MVEDEEQVRVLAQSVLQDVVRWIIWGVAECSCLASSLRR